MKTETVKIYGNCEMCKAVIEKSGSVKNVSTVKWDADTKTATLSYDIKKTDQDIILKRIALAGYDNEKYLAPDDIYARLPECCRYERALKPIAQKQSADSDMKNGQHHDHGAAPANTSGVQQTRALQAVFDSYFLLKDALVQANAGTVSVKAGTLVQAIKAVEITKLSAEEHHIWTKISADLSAGAQNIAAGKDISGQRASFALLSPGIYELAKVSKPEGPIYYQHCPMYNSGKGADWLSKEETIKNPYYGTQMLNCGSTTEVLD